MPSASAPSVPGLDDDVPVGLLGGARAHGIDDHDLRTFFLRLQDEGPGVQVGADHVHAPHDDVLRVGEALQVQPAGRADGHDPGRRRSGLAIGFLRYGRSQAIEERVARREPVERPLVPEIDVGHDRLRAVGRDDVRPAAFDFRESIAPRNALEQTAALGAGAPHRVEQPVGVVVMLCKAVKLDAEASARHRMIGIAGHIDQLAVLDVVQESARIGTVVWACTSHDAIASV